VKNSIQLTPDTATGNKMTANETLPRFGTKRDVCALVQMRSERWVNDMISLGMPCIRIGSRRTRFDLSDVVAWLKEKYGEQRCTPARPSTARNKSQKAKAT
jgi:hypothetical protein